MLGIENWNNSHRLNLTAFVKGPTPQTSPNLYEEHKEQLTTGSKEILAQPETEKWNYQEKWCEWLAWY